MDKETASERLRLRLPPARRGRGWTSQAAFAERLAEVGSDLDESAVARIETGRRAIKLDEAFEIADALGVGLADMVLVGRHEGALKVGSQVLNPAAAFGLLVGEFDPGDLDEEPTLDELVESGRVEEAIARLQKALDE